MAEISGNDRITSARISGVARRRAVQLLNGQCTESDAVAELRAVSGGRPDLLAKHAGMAIGAIEDELPMRQAIGREEARLCMLAGADTDAEAIATWIQTSRQRARGASRLPFSRPPAD